jgi:uncharacterized membrane protein
VNYYAVGASFLGTGVEFVEALTIILAVGAVRGWKSSLLGAVSAIVVLAVLLGVIGAPLASIVQLFWVQFLVGLLMLLFGIRWLRKAILRYSGLKALHNESESYEEELARARQAGEVSQGIDKFAFSTAFGGTFLEGLEAIFIVIAFGIRSNAMTSAVVGAAAATVFVILLGITLRQPLAKIPENTMKYIVGVMLTSFGAFWVGESLHVNWPQADLSIVYLIVTLLAFSWLMVARVKKQLSRSRNHDNRSATGVN